MHIILCGYSIATSLVFFLLLLVKRPAELQSLSPVQRIHAKEIRLRDCSMAVLVQLQEITFGVISIGIDLFKSTVLVRLMLTALLKKSYYV